MLLSMNYYWKPFVIDEYFTTQGLVLVNSTYKYKDIHIWIPIIFFFKINAIASYNDLMAHLGVILFTICGAVQNAYTLDPFL